MQKLRRKLRTLAQEVEDWVLAKRGNIRSHSKAYLNKVIDDLDRQNIRLCARVNELRTICDSLEQEDYEIIEQLTAANEELTKQLKEMEEKLFQKHGFEGHEVQS